MNGADPEILAQMRSLRPALPPAEETVADYLLAHPGEAPFLSVHEVARAAGVSHASVTRLSAALGCRTFRHLKIRLARHSPEAAISDLYEALLPHDSDEDIARKTFAGNVRSLQDTLQILDYQALGAAARSIAAARKVVFFGIGSSASLAGEAALRFMQVDVETAAPVEPLRMLTEAARMNEHRVAVGISHSGESALTSACLKLARQRGAATIGISNYPRSHLRRWCDCFLSTAFPETRVRAAALSSLLAQLCLIDALFLLVARHRKATPTIEKLNQVVEQMLRARTPAQAVRAKDDTPHKKERIAQ